MVILPINFGRCTYFVKGKLWEQQIDHYFSNGIFSCCNLLGAKINVFMLKYCAFPQSRRKAPPLRFTGTMLKIKTLGHYLECVKLTSSTPEWSCLKSSLCLFRQIGHLFSCIVSNGNLGPVEFSWNSSVQTFFICRDANRFKLYQYQILLLQCQQLNSLTFFVSLMWNTDAAFNFGFNGRLILV